MTTTTHTADRNATHATVTSAPTTPHYTLSIIPYTTTYTHDDGHTETVEIAELIATSETGEQFSYVGPVACSTRDQALALHARIFAWEWATGKAFDPTRNPRCWLRLTDGPDEASPAASVAHEGLGEPIGAGNAAHANHATASVGNGPAKPGKGRRKGNSGKRQ